MMTTGKTTGYAARWCCAQMIDRLGWKFLYIRPQAPETRGGLCMCVEAGRMQACPR